jgi:hypothetical protein
MDSKLGAQATAGPIIPENESGEVVAPVGETEVIVPVEEVEPVVVVRGAVHFPS